MSSTSNQSQEKSSSVSKLSNGYLLLSLLLLAYILSFIDRNIMAILISPIREEFDISDTAYGALNGVAFSLLYTFIGIPIAWLADRKSRVNIIAIGTAFWSVMTFLCGLATGFTSFFVARMGVGVGEAALSPPAHSLLADYFPKEKLPTVMAIFTLGIPVGIGVSYTLGGWIYGELLEHGNIVLPLLGAIKPWQATFMIVGFPGLILAFFISRMVEPQRPHLNTNLGNSLDLQANAQGFAQTWSFLKQHYLIYFNIFMAIACLSIVGYGFMMWFVEHMSRAFNEPAHELSQLFGILYLFVGSAGTLGGAFFAAWLVKKGFEDAGIRLVFIVAISWIIPAIAAPLMPSLSSAQWMAIPYILLLNGYFGVSIAALQIITPLNMRAQVSAVLLFATNVFGLIVGPLIIGFLSDFIFAQSGQLSLAYALAATGGVFCSLAAILIFLSLKPYRALLSASDND